MTPLLVVIVLVLVFLIAIIATRSKKSKQQACPSTDEELDNAISRFNKLQHEALAEINRTG
jgi:hypothetical protein